MLAIDFGDRATAVRGHGRYPGFLAIPFDLYWV
jgi:hypothetical protein